LGELVEGGGAETTFGEVDGTEEGDEIGVGDDEAKESEDVFDFAAGVEGEASDDGVEDAAGEEGIFKGA